MTAAPEASALEARVGHYYEADGLYLVGREKVREYARAVQDYNPAHWDVDAAAKLGYSGLVAPLTFTSTPAMACNRRMFESIVVGYDTLPADRRGLRAAPPDRGRRRTARRRRADVGPQDRRPGHDHRDQHLHGPGRRARAHPATTVVGVTAEDLNPEIKTAVQRAMMHDVDIFGISDDEYEKTVRPEGEIRIAEDTTRTPGTLSFDDLKVGDEIGVHHTRLSRGDLVNYAGVAGDANPIHWDEDIAKLAGLPDVIAHGMLTMGLGAGFVSTWSGDPGAVTRYAVRLSRPRSCPPKKAPTSSSAARSSRLTPETRTGVVIVAAKADGKKIFGLATMNIRFS